MRLLSMATLYCCFIAALLALPALLGGAETAIFKDCFADFNPIASTLNDMKAAASSNPIMVISVSAALSILSLIGIHKTD